jgi:hypothetical protein
VKGRLPMDDTLIRILKLAAGGYACSQIMILLALEKNGESNPALVRAMAGLAYGGGSGMATCGVLTGAHCVIGYFSGKGADEERENERMPLMLEELNTWFQEEVGARHDGITCDAIVGEAGPHASRSTCGNILVKTYARTIAILADHGFDR